MTIITAKILDPTHLELTEPIAAQPGEYVQLSVMSAGEDDHLWREAGKKRLLEAYDDQDAVYDDL